ncbi:MAG: hypothetical protein BGO49_06510 [Planctomycetales bacterium 71-10]|nr:MAG: hypothetical protein BGO49_06510 [Planctomycetales bacterium 71-10]
MISQDWYEIWVDEGLDLPYVLVVLPDATRSGGVQIVDPKEGNKVVFRSHDYDEVRSWLLEDEYAIIGERVFREV